MKPAHSRAAGAAVAVLLCTALGAAGEAAPVPKKKATAAPVRKAPAKAQAAAKPATPVELGATELSIAPGSFMLDGSRSVEHLVVTGTFPDGTTRDVTDMVTFNLSNPAVVTVQGGIAHPKADGQTRVVAQAGKVASKPVEILVRNSGAPAPIQFVNDVMPILAKAGCNSTACHGSPAGKGGLKLSLFGYEPELDHAAFTKEGNRLNLKSPADSLLLQKSVMSVPHAGGQRFKVNSAEYATLLAWVKDGARGIGEFEPRVKKVELVPEQPWIPAAGVKQRLAVFATMSDGSVLDVTAGALFSSGDDAVADVDGAGIVTGKRPGESAVMVRYLGQVAVSRVSVLPSWKLAQYPQLARNNRIDDLVQAKLKKLRVVPSEVCTDEEFIRRATLDTCGIIPTSEEVRAFLQDTAPDKRSKLVETLLARPEFVDLWTMKWNDTLRNSPKLLRYSYTTYADWIRQQIAANRPYDQFVRDLITASGKGVETNEQGIPVTANANEAAKMAAKIKPAKQAKLAKQARKAMRAGRGTETLAFNPAANYYLAAKDPLDVAAATSQVFLGVRIECARCHNHPFEKWTQNDFYGFASFFTGVAGKGKYPMAVQVNLNAAPLRMPKTNEVAEPRALDTPDTAIPSGSDPRIALANWMTSAENPFFAREMANRVWAHYLGRGIVEPVDDFRVTNPASNPELLDGLAQELVSHQFDVKAVHRLILNSRTYQQSSTPNQYNRDDVRNFARFYPKRLMAEQLYDSISEATGMFLNDGGARARRGKKAMAAAGGKKGSRVPAGAERVLQLPTLALNAKGGATGPAQFLDTFGKPHRESVCECERSNDGNMGQALMLLNGDEVNAKIAAPNSRVQKLIASGRPDAEVVEEIFVATLSRRPTRAQSENAVNLIHSAKTRNEGIEDLAWSLLNSREFLFVH